MDSAIDLEREAYAAAQAQSSTTTGNRPIQESKKFYLRQVSAFCRFYFLRLSKLAELILDFVKNHGVFDLSGSGRRDFLPKETAETLFQSLHQTAQLIHKIILSGKSFGEEAVDVACNALSKVTRTLVDADLSDIIGGRPENEALIVLKKLSTTLSSATLSSVNLSSNALGEKGLRACYPLFESQTGLESLTLHNIGCSPNACKALKELTSNMKLKGLYLYNNMSGDEGAMAIAEIISRMPTLQHFQMSSSRVGLEGVQSLTKALKQCDALISLDLNDNPATAESVSSIVELLDCQPNLKRLNLSDMSLEIEGIVQLSKALIKSVPNLEVLELALNEITFEATKCLGPAIAAKSNLKVLDLKENELEDAGGLVIAKAIQSNGALEELNVSNNMLHGRSAVSIVTALSGKSQFRKLLIDGNEIAESAITEMKEMLVTMFGNLSVLGSLEENDFDADESSNFMDVDPKDVDLDQLIERIGAICLEK